MSAEIIERISQIPALSWDSCAGATNPFLSHAFLSALEDAGCIGSIGGNQTGWAARHVLIKDDTGTLIACAPLYLKSHSQGEYVFDHGWAEAYERAGGTYYPKLVCAVPFTPVTGSRFLINSSCSEAQNLSLKSQLAAAIAGLAMDANLSSAHVNFTPPKDQASLEGAGFLSRIGIQYHWHNNGYDDYSNFLDELTSRKRKALKKERRVATQDGIHIQRLSGTDIQPHHWDAMHGFYQDTSARKWGRPYLNREFFHLLGERMADRVLLVLAFRGPNIIAGALNLIGDDALYGRYWGCSEDVPFLHFELSYHQALEAAIERGLARVEAGAQGEHKIARGYLPTFTHSAHFITNESFRAAVATFLGHERKALEHEFNILMVESPYRKTDV